MYEIGFDTPLYNAYHVEAVFLYYSKKGLIQLNELPYTIKDLQKMCANNRILWKDHAQQRLLQRNILRSEVKQCILSGEIIEKYIDDKPFPSCLILGYTKNSRPLHIVCSFDNNSMHIITVYEPDKIKFNDDLKTRRI